jgi:hypothetical protein
MSLWKYLIRFEASDGQVYVSSLPTLTDASDLVGSAVTGFASFADLLKGDGGTSVTVQKVTRKPY